MKMQKLSSVRGNRQAGFTLIELIVVIVILGILAATALPKFADLGGDARVSTVKAARGALEATSAMVHGKFLVTTPAPASVSLEGATVAITHGYPTADAAFVTASGLSANDWSIQVGVLGATANSPATLAGQITFIPVSAVGSPKGLTCYVQYAQAASAGAAPIVAAVTSGC